MQNFYYAIKQSPIGIIIPIWRLKPTFSLIKLSIITLATSNLFLIKELKQIGFSQEELPSFDNLLLESNTVDKLKIIENLFAKSQLFNKSENHVIEKLKDTLEQYFISKLNIKFDTELLELKNCSEFTRKVLLTLKEVPLGEVCTYGSLAKSAGYPKAYRAVGSVMNKNPFPLIIPCHRVILSNGNIGEFTLGKETKKFLLQHEV